MTTINRLVAVGSIVLLGMTCQQAFAMYPDCSSNDSDPDGDGFGWENNATCVVIDSDAATNDLQSTLPVCSSVDSDPDNDGYGWENNTSCLVDNTTSNSASDVYPACVSRRSDPDGDGYGFENGASCLVTDSTALINDDGGSATSNGLTFPSCVSRSSDSDGDGYGFENGTSCLVTDNTAMINSDGGSGTSNGVTYPACTSGSSDPDGDGYGFENGSTCKTTGIVNDDDGSSTSNGVMPEDGNTTEGNTNHAGSFDSGNGGEIIRTISLMNVGDATSTTGASGGDNFRTIPVGDFLLMQNAWRAWRAPSGYDWSQSIYTSAVGAPVGWSYDWGPGTPGATGRASDDYYVRSYPELILGIKDEFRTSATKAEIGLPVRVDAMPFTEITYAFDAPQYGAAREVDASVNPAYPNGTTISGERNVAIESFMYLPENDACDDSLNVNRTGGSNHVYEVMVWIDTGAERLPAAPADYVTTINLRGSDYRVYTKNTENRYIAFVTENPQTTGTMYWNDFLDWARLNAHVVRENFGARSNSVQIQDSWCVANIIIGTEIFWGAGNLDLTEWTITQRQR